MGAWAGRSPRGRGGQRIPTLGLCHLQLTLQSCHLRHKKELRLRSAAYACALTLTSRCGTRWIDLHLKCSDLSVKQSDTQPSPTQSEEIGVESAFGTHASIELSDVVTHVRKILCSPLNSCCLPAAECTIVLEILPTM